MDVKIEESWKKRLADEFEKDYFKQLTDFVKQEYRQGTVYPPGPYMFNAFEHCPFDKVKVVILGQDPYHEPGQAHGLCFSVQDGVPFPPSLINIFKEIQDDSRASGSNNRQLDSLGRSRRITAKRHAHSTSASSRFPSK